MCSSDLAHSAVLLVAEPGAGKTTRVPLALRETDWLKGQRIVMLEPRRAAARAAARRMAQSLHEEAGGTVGYSVRLDSKVSAKTRIEVVTEGILTRRIQADPALTGTGLLITVMQFLEADHDPFLMEQTIPAAINH